MHAHLVVSVLWHEEAAARAVRYDGKRPNPGRCNKSVGRLEQLPPGEAERDNAGQVFKVKVVQTCSQSIS